MKRGPKRRASATDAELRAFEAEVDHALAVARPSDSWDLVGFGIDLSFALLRWGQAPRPTATTEPRCLLVVRCVVPHDVFASRALRRRLGTLFRRNLSYRHHGAHVVIVEPHRALLRFVTRTGDGPHRIVVTGAIEIVPKHQPSKETRRALAALLRRGTPVHRPAR